MHSFWKIAFLNLLSYLEFSKKHFTGQEADFSSPIYKCANIVRLYNRNGELGLTRSLSPGFLTLPNPPGIILKSAGQFFPVESGKLYCKRKSKLSKA